MGNRKICIDNKNIEYNVNNNSSGIVLESIVKDIENWNKKHGIMWILYGIAIVIGIVGGLIVGDSPLLVVIYCGSLLLPIVIMVLYHKKLVKDYIIE